MNFNKSEIIREISHNKLLLRLRYQRTEREKETENKNENWKIKLSCINEVKC